MRVRLIIAGIAVAGIVSAGLLVGQRARQPILGGGDQAAGNSSRQYHFDFGFVRQGDVLAHTFTVQNPHRIPINVSSVRTTCGCTVAERPAGSVLPGELLEIPVRLKTAGKRFGIQQHVTLSFAEPVPEVELYVKANILPELVVTPEKQTIVVPPGEAVVREVRIDHFGENELQDIAVTLRARSAGVLEPPQVLVLEPVAPQAGYGGMCRQSWVAEIRFQSEKLPPGRSECVLNVESRGTSAGLVTASVSWILDVKPRVDIVPANLFLDFNQSMEVVREVRLFYWDESLAERVPELELSSDLPFEVAVEYKPRQGRSRIAQLRFSAPAGFAGSARGKLYFRNASSGGEMPFSSILALRHGEVAGANE